MTEEKPQIDEKKCAPCAINAGVAILFNVAENAKIEHEDVKTKLFDGQIDVQNAFDTVKERLKEKKDDFSIQLVEETERVVRSEVEAAEQQEAEAIKEPIPEDCVSIIVKNQTLAHIDTMIENRQSALKEMEGKANAAFVEGTKELLENLTRSKQMIENLPTCEENKKRREM